MDFFKEFERLSLNVETPRGRTLLIADPHIGFELSRGLRVRTHFEERLAEFILEEDPDLLIILGDVKEPIGLSFMIKRLLMGFFSDLRGIPTAITKGNHDGRIGEVAEKFRNVEVADYLLLDDTLFLHGHTTLPRVEFNEAYLGHIHPAYTFKRGGVSRKVKVFVRAGRFLILPTINPFIEGFDVREGIRMVPFLKDAPSAELFLPEGIHLGSINLLKFSHHSEMG
ncbi:metallophosphoesterase [Thermococcus sp.]|uniref:metallophosphoesterase n=1 Tax=Thermococcus sp. TaxID=35749 RepID=UPI00263404EB|nr:metallophosphoesterase [Thermococcus sp.]